MIEKKREYLFDNIKALLIILVVFGHIIEYLGLKGIMERINVMIFVFHMPFFIFVSGYFCNNFKNIENKSIKNILIPFFIFNTGYIILFNLLDNKIVFKLTEPINIFEPVYAYWYLFSLFIWKILLNYAKRFKYSIILLVLLSLYVGTINSINRNFSLSRTIVYFPFFMLGYYTDKEMIEKIRSIDKKITITILGILLVGAFFMTRNIFTLDLLKNAQSYHISGTSNRIGILVRVLQLIFAIGISTCIINLISENKNWLSNIGKKTITIYLLSPFVQQYMANQIIRNIPEILNNKLISLSICVISTIFIVYFFSRDAVFNTYNKFIDWIYRIITIKEDDEKLKKKVYFNVDKL